jgi:hypothetical protein
MLCLITLSKYIGKSRPMFHANLNTSHFTLRGGTRALARFPVNSLDLVAITSRELNW